MIAVTTVTTHWVSSLLSFKVMHYNLFKNASLTSCRNIYLRGSGTRHRHLRSPVHHCTHCSIKRQSKGGGEGGDLSWWLPARIKREPPISTPWGITQVVVDLHLSTFCCRGDWLPSQKSGKLQTLPLHHAFPVICRTSLWPQMLPEQMSHGQN